jgi:iron(III) transport system ATP-binding protein
MEAFKNTKVKNLSGGQKQRVAIARALANEPELLLLDEPFGQIDNFKKNSLRRKLFAYLKERNITCIVATHDKNDALSFADQLIVIRNKKMITNGIPREIYNNPKEEYIAALFDDVNKVVLEGKTVLLYPHQIKIIENPENHTAPVSAKATVLDSYFKGSYWLIEADFDGQIVFFNHFSDLQEKKVIHIYFILKRI